MNITVEIQEKYILWAKRVLGGEVTVSKEPHGDEGAVYELRTEKEVYFLKIGKGFAKERARLDWLQRKLPVPRVIDFLSEGDMEAMILTAIPGKNLKVYSREWSVEQVIDGLVVALHLFHATDTTDWHFDSKESGSVLVHGDACLPNLIFLDTTFSGFIDLGAVRLGSPEIDLAAAVWSLEYNMGTGHGVQLLRAYGWHTTTEGEVERLRNVYTDYQREKGFSL